MKEISFTEKKMITRNFLIEKCPIKEDLKNENNTKTYCS